ncbi:MAG: 4-hydroxy-tetrahydrodipicolinate reductase [Clostridiales Family XIII bacterium]|jgi:4-hydroxy-tetrahydrodipicolinate reductase|nr:4-hydroxy-tetrahydrodipicolinate reductase [Clostridiales Family XIII bacterium]
MDFIINGINGKMGRMILESLSREDDAAVLCGFDKQPATAGNEVRFRGVSIPVFDQPSAFTGKADVIIDFSHYTAVPDLLRYAVLTGTPAVICTTALGEAERDLLREASLKIPVFNSSNMSLGINIIAKMCKLAMPALESNFNVEIIEKHHTQKIDSPSGTAILLADAVNEACEVKKDYLYGRHSKHDECKLTDLGIHAVRGGTLPGQHTVLFAGSDETIEITHTAYSRSVFAQGAIKAAYYIAGKKPGFYTMDDVIA